MGKDIDVYIATEQRFMKYNDTMYAQTIAGESFWQRYLDVFSRVYVVARVQSVTRLPEAVVPVEGDRIHVVPMPSYIGPIAAVRKMPSLWLGMGFVAQKNAAFILRVPGILGTILFHQLQKRKWPYAVEVVGDPHDSLSPRAIRKIWSHLARPILVGELRQQCWNATAAAYVTREALQRNYPVNKGFSTYYSDPSDDFINLAVSCQQQWQQVKPPREKHNPRLIFIGSLSQRYKGLHILLKALRQCRTRNLTFELEILGDGKYRQEYERMAEKLELANVVVFQGFVKQGKEVFDRLCQADLFVMPSLTEGLPRAMIEAMACGLPCIGSSVGGIPELLSPDEMVPPGNAQLLANKIMEILQDPDRMQRLGKSNREKALEYHTDILRPRRQQFYSYLRDITLDYIS